MLDRIIENLIGCMILPPGIGVNFFDTWKGPPSNFSSFEYSGGNTP
ncbi:MAG: hypothetical protein QXJ27_05025 [Thermoplasmata archaeon]